MGLKRFLRCGILGSNQVARFQVDFGEFGGLKSSQKIISLKNLCFV